MRAETSSQQLDFPVAGMSCAVCAASIERVLNRLPGVQAQVNLAAEQAHLSYDPQQAQPAQFLQAIERAGFSVPRRQVVLGVEGMTCQACSAAVERALQALPGVEAQVNLATAQVRITYQPALLDEAALHACIRQTGYQPHAQLQLRGQALQARERDERRAWQADRRQAIIASLLALPLLLPMLAMAWPGLGHWLPAGGLPRGWQLLLATPVQCWAGARFYRAGWKALRGRHANMDVLVALGTSAAYGYSLVLVLGGWPGAVYFDSSAVIISLILWGRLMEARARRRTTAAVRALTQLQPEQARVERDGQVLLLDVGNIMLGDIVQIPAGEPVPVDGTVLAGSSDVDESMLSGEAMPVPKQVGSAVHAASINGAGWLRVAVDQVGADTLLARIIRRVEQAQGSKAPVQRLADRIAAIFVPAVLALALLTLLLTWYGTGQVSTAMVHAVAVLVIACPCSLGLATPTAIMVGAGVAARQGIMVRDAAVLERLAQVRVAVFDKTGTVTQGRPQLLAIQVAPEQDRLQLLQMAASLEAGSAHPLAQAFLQAAQAAALPLHALQQLHTVPGQGLQAELGTDHWRLGRLEWLLQGGPAPDWLLSPEAGDGAGHTLAGLACNDRLLACFVIADSLRADAVATLAALQQMGLRTVLLSGDRPQVATAVARQLGMDDCIAGVLPEAKADRIEQWQQATPGAVAMIGDGINDAPALATADVGIAMGGGATVALETAGVVLMQDHLSGVVQAIAISRATLRTIRQNLGFAFGYNLIGLPLAALGWLDPMLAGGLMALSSVSVVANSLRLGRRSHTPGFLSDATGEP